MTTAAALQGKTINDVLSQQRDLAQKIYKLQKFLEAVLDVVLWDIRSDDVLIGE